MAKQKKINSDKEIPQEQQNMIERSKQTAFERNQRHFNESERTRVEGFSKARDHKNQLKRDYQNREDQN